MSHHHHGRTVPTAAALRAQRAQRQLGAVRPEPEPAHLTEDDLKLLRPLARRAQIDAMAEQLGLPPIPTKEEPR